MAWDLLREVAIEDVGLPHHGTDPAHLEHQPLDGLGATLGICRQQLARLLRQIEEDGAGLEHGEITIIPIDDGRDTTVGVDGQKLGLLLIQRRQIERDHPIGAQLFEGNRHLEAVGRSGGIKSIIMNSL